MNLHEELVSDLSHLPTEILCQIFIQCLPQTDYMLPNSKSPPILLTRICRRWREITMDMPSLWCRLSMDIHFATGRNWRQAIFYYDSWLKRTRGRPLSLEIMCIENDNINLQIILQPYISQISSLKITFDKAVAPEILLNDLPALQELRVDISRDVVVKDHSTLSRILSPISGLLTLRSLDLELLFPYNIKRLSRPNPTWPLKNSNLGLCHPSIIIGLLQLFSDVFLLKIQRMLLEDGLSFEPLAHSTTQFCPIRIACKTLIDPA
ncbi:hypothetical protein BD769DRAFT_107518 [Suillus cothurnatus]|nr:hypothetical protein BD769DRAFT_107518 [Suillus cothurnatus]